MPDGGVFDALSRQLQRLDAQLSRLESKSRQDAAWNEGDHPRDEDGKFASGGGGKKSQTFGKKGSATPAGLHGVAFKKWSPPTSTGGWQKLADSGPKINAPPVPPLPRDKVQGSGVIIQEPDGRVWIMHPRGGFGGYKATFPKGQQDEGLSLRANAIKEAYEETGLHVELTGYAGDVERGTSNARYYFARRVGGTPDDHGEEAEGVTLAPVEELEDHLNRSVDRKMVSRFLKPKPEAKTLKLSAMKQVGKQLGSNPGGRFEAPNGKRYYVKFSKSDAHAKNELLAARLYEAAGSPILKAEPVDMGNGKLATATEWKEGVSLIDRKNPEQRKAAQENFATHAWLANWDAAGLEYDNQGLVDGKMTTLDPGGSLIFRAQGGPKGQAFGYSANEWNTLRDPSNHQAHAIYGDMTRAQLQASAKKVADIPDETVREMVLAEGPGDEKQRQELATKLIARKHDIARRAGLAGKDARIDDAGWKEADHPRVPKGEPGGGQFTAGGVGTASHNAGNIPDPPWWTSKYGPQIKELVSKALKEALNPYDVAEEIKKIAGGKSHYVPYANKAIAHLAQAHGQKANVFGKAAVVLTPAEQLLKEKAKAKKKGKGEEPVKEEEPTPTPEPEPEAQTGLPKPETMSQEKVYQIFNSDEPHSVKISKIKDKIPGYGHAPNKEYAEKALKELGYEPEEEPAKEAEPTEGDWPKADPSSPFQQNMVSFAEDPGLPLDTKLESLKAIAGTNPGSPKAKLAEKLIAKLEGEPKKPEFPTMDPEGTSSHSQNKAALIHAFANDGSMSVEQKVAAIESVVTVSNKVNEYKQKAINHLTDQPVAEEEPEKPKGPDPYPGSKGQAAVYEAATGEGTDAEKIAKINEVLEDVKLTGPKTKEFGEAWIKAIKGEAPEKPPEPAKEPKKPAVKAAPKGKYGGTVITAPKTTARYKHAVARADAAKKPSSTHDAEAHDICPTLAHDYWAGVSSAAKSSLKAYWDGEYDAINDALRTKNPKGISATTKKNIDRIDEMFFDPKAELQHETRLTRGVDVPASKINEWVQQLEEGVPCAAHMTGFVSTSMAETPAFSSKNTWFIMTCKKGTPALGIDTISSHSENEILLRHGQAFEVYQVERTPERTYVYMVSS